MIQTRFDPTTHTNAPLQIEKFHFIDAPQEAVWKVVSDHEGMTAWVPMIRHVAMTEANAEGEWGEGCHRQCQFGDDLLDEKIIYWDPPRGYAYSVADMHLLRDHVGWMELSERDGGTQIRWRQYFRPNGNFVKNFVAKHVMLPGVMTRALKNLGKQVTG